MASRTLASIEPIHAARRGRGRGPVSRVILDWLQAAIVAGELEPDSALSETEIAGRFGVSRTPVREAIGRLAEDGLVVVVPQVGTFVGRISLDEVLEGQFIRETLEVEAVRQAARLPQPTRASDLRRFLDLQRSAIEAHDLGSFYQADEDLHAGVFALIGQPGVWHAMRTVKLHMDRLRRMSLPERNTLEALVDEHERIVDAIEAGDADAAETVLRGHARRVLGYGPEIAREFPERFARGRQPKEGPHDASPLRASSAARGGRP